MPCDCHRTAIGLPSDHLLIATVPIELQPLLEEEDPELEAAKFWLKIRTKGKDVGRLLLSIQLVPVEDVKKFPAGKGRSEPNTNPTLPKPVGRLTFTLNPFTMLSQLIGPEYCWKLKKICCCFFCTLISVLLIYYMFPVVFGNALTSMFGFR